MAPHVASKQKSLLDNDGLSNYQALENQLEMDMPPHLLRGVFFSTMVAGFGRLLRHRPDSFTAEEQTKLYDCSVPVEFLAYFFSHSWGSPGYQKYFALLFHIMAPWAFASALLCAAAMYLFQEFHGPLLGVTVTDTMIKMSFYQSPWEFAAGILGGWAVLMLGPKIVSWPGFLDGAVIHQTDQRLKLEGICHLPAFLAKSKELVIAWDPLYFTRGWCMYELAIFRGLNPDGVVKILPLKFFTKILYLHLWNVAGCVLFFVSYTLIGDGVLSTVISNVVCLIAVAHTGDALAMEKAQMKQQLKTFSFENANVQVQSDREQIIESINGLWEGGLEEFDQTVRTQICQNILDEFDSCRSMLPFSMLLIASTPNFFMLVSYSSSYRSLPTSCRVTQALFSSAYFFFLPCLFALCMKMGSVRRCTGIDEVEAVDDGTPLSPRHFGVGIACAVLQVFFNVIACAIPWTISARAGSYESLKLGQEWIGPLMAGTWLIVCICLARCTFKRLAV